MLLSVATLFIFLRVSMGTNITSKDWPCPLAEDIAPCVCSYRDSRIEMVCDNVVMLKDIQRIFSQHFPFPEMGESNDMR